MSLVPCLLSFPAQNYIFSIKRASKSTPNNSQMIKKSGFPDPRRAFSKIFWGLEEKYFQKLGVVGSEIIWRE